MPFHRDDLTLLLHVPEGLPNVPTNFEFICYRNNLRRKLSLHFNLKKGPYWIVIGKEDWLLCFISNTIILNIVKLRIAKYGKIIFNGLFQKKSVFQKTSSILMKVVP